MNKIILLLSLAIVVQGYGQLEQFNLEENLQPFARVRVVRQGYGSVGDFDGPAVVPQKQVGGYGGGSPKPYGGGGGIPGQGFNAGYGNNGPVMFGNHGRQPHAQGYGGRPSNGGYGGNQGKPFGGQPIGNGGIGGGFSTQPVGNGGFGGQFGGNPHGNSQLGGGFGGGALPQSGGQGYGLSGPTAQIQPYPAASNGYSSKPLPVDQGFGNGYNQPAGVPPQDTYSVPPVVKPGYGVAEKAPTGGAGGYGR